jgi:hypothetical protein
MVPDAKITATRWATLLMYVSAVFIYLLLTGLPRCGRRSPLRPLAAAPLDRLLSLSLSLSPLSRTLQPVPSAHHAHGPLPGSTGHPPAALARVTNPSKTAESFVIQDSLLCPACSSSKNRFFESFSAECASVCVLVDAGRDTGVADYPVRAFSAYPLPPEAPSSAWRPH